MSGKGAHRVPEAGDLAARSTLYERVRDDLLRRISDGTFGPGDRLPSERELCQNYGVSKITVRRAISELAQKGVLYTVQGKGSFIAGGQRRGGSQGVIRFVTSRHAPDRGITKRVLEAFVEEEPGCRVETVMLALNQRTQEVVRGGLADLFVVREDELQGLMREGVLLDLTGFVERDLDMEAYYSEPFPFCCIRSRLYAFPVTFSPIVMVYNRAHFHEAGLDYPDDWDWTTLLDYARRLTVREGKDGQVTRYGLFLRGDTNRWTTFLLQNNGGVFDANGNFILDSARSLEALRFCHDLMVKHRVAPIGAPAERMRPFVIGAASMFLESYYLRHHTEADFEWDMGRLPRGRTQATLYVGTHLGIHRQCRDPELAWKLLKFFVSPFAQRLFLERRNGGPVLRSAMEGKGEGAWPPRHRDLFWEEMAVVRPIYWGTDSTEMKAVVSGELQMVWTGMETPEEACADIRQRIGLAKGCIRF